MINFTSTRDKNLRLGFWESIIQGAASDGGLLVPENFPKISRETILNKEFWEKSQIFDISALLHGLFVPEGEIYRPELEEIMKTAHSFDMPLESIFANDFVLRLDHGPTASFKDVAARSLAGLMGKYCEKFDKNLNIVVATSGDTGVAIADAFGNSSHISITILYPSDGVSPIQEKQMIDIHCKYEKEQSIPLAGNFDSCQDVSKTLQSIRGIRGLPKEEKEKKVQQIIEDFKVKLKQDIDEKYIDEIADIIDKINLSSANSINIWRLIPQMTQYFVAYSKLVKKGVINPGDEIVFAVPTGNVGHLMAGIYAREVGLPIKSFVMGTNANNILANVIGSGKIKHKGFCKTSSPSMDILDPSNLERLLDFARFKTGSVAEIDYIQMKKDIKKIDEIVSASKKKVAESKDDEDVKMSLEYYRDITEGFQPIAKYGVESKVLDYLRGLVWAEDVETDEEVYAMMSYIYKKTNLVLEPHGVSALIALFRARAKGVLEKDDVVVVLETAHPDKFPTALEFAEIKVPLAQEHAVLEKIKKMDLDKMEKPETQPLDPLIIARKMVELAGGKG